MSYCHMPIGLITDVSATALGGILGNFIGKYFSEPLKASLNNIFGTCAMAIGIRLIVKMDNLSAVVLATVLGTILGETLRIEERINAGVSKMVPLFFKDKDVDSSYINTFCAVAVLFSCSGTGWYGVLTEGFTGDGSILITKAILGFFTALIFAATLGRMISVLSIPQLVIYLVLFAFSRMIGPYITPAMIADFSAVGGIVELTTGMRIAGIKRDTKVLNIIPGMLLIFPISALWLRIFGN